MNCRKGATPHVEPPPSQSTGLECTGGILQGPLFAHCRGLRAAIVLVLTSPADFARLLTAVRALSGTTVESNVHDVLEVHSDFVARYSLDSHEVRRP